MRKDNRHSLIFPSNRDHKVSPEAINLIGNLLQEKDCRISSGKYMLNDYQHSKYAPGQLVHKCSNPSSTDYKGRFVYPDDATDIKSHPFFDRIVWDRHHLTRPPFVPDIRARDDTKYFDEEDPVSDVDDAASQSSDHEDADRGASGNIGDWPVTQYDGPNGQQDQVADHATVYHTKEPSKDAKIANGKTKKRPRDKVLRDKEMGRIALELRKKGAFIGYTYRRPKLSSFNDEPGR